jgi:outer membrane protein assembly factor BamB
VTSGPNRGLRAAALVAALAAPVAAAESPSASSTVFRFDNRHTGVAPGPAGPALAGLRWTFDAHGPVRGSPVLASGLVLFGGGDGNLYALDPATGRERWRAPLGGAVASTPAVAEGLVVATARDRIVSAVDLATGRPRWRFEAGKEKPFEWEWDFWLSSPTIAGGTVFVGAGDGNLYALDLSSGRRLWQFATGGRVRSSPAVSDGVVWFGSMDGKVYALDAKTGRLQWAFETEGVTIDQKAAGFDRRSIVSSPSLSADLLFVGSRDAHLYAVDRKTGKQAWRFGHKIESMEGEPEVSWVLGSPAVSEGLVFTGSSDGHFFNAVKAESGHEIWRFKTPGNVLSSGALAGGQVFFGCEEGHVFALDARTGAERWRFRTGGAVISSPAVEGGIVYVGSDDGFLYALETGPERARARARRAVYWKDPAGHAWFEGNGAVKDYFVSEGYDLLDEAGLARFLAGLADAPRSVVVVAIDTVPQAVVSGPPEDTALRKYLAAGGRMVWLGLPIDAIERDPATGQAIRFDPSRSGRLIGVDHTVGRADWMGARATTDGRRWGVPEWYVGGFAVPAGDVTTVLGLDEWGRSSAWVKSFGGPAGSGFVRLWGRKEPIGDMAWVKAVAEYAE